MREFEKKKLYGLINLAEQEANKGNAFSHKYENIAELLRQCELRIDEFEGARCCRDKNTVRYTFKATDQEVLNQLTGLFKSDIVGLIEELLEDDFELSMDEYGEVIFETKLVQDIEKLEVAPKHTFENCQKVLIGELEKAEHSIFAAVAWFTNENVLDVLIKKAKEGVDVVLLLDQGRKPNPPVDKGDTKNYCFISSKGYLPFHVYPCLNLNQSFQNIMHHKFCIIDNKVVVHGTYNWTKKAEYNDEDITIDGNDKSVADFNERFKSLRVKYKKIYTWNCPNSFWE